jgi:Sulfotransferase family
MRDRDMDIERADPIFILGIMPRSGTNFLWDLLCLHPDCGPARAPVMEDFFLQASDHLIAYTRAVRDWWDPKWGIFDKNLMAEFHRAMGDGLISFLWVDRERRLVTKTPSVAHVDRFFTFFPKARLIVLVRDGRSVAQSAMSTFGWDLDRAARNWARAASEIRRFRSREPRWADRWRLVRYEDLLGDVKALSPILQFAELDEKVYDFEAASQLPVRGSSFYFGPSRRSVHWEPVSKGPDFTPKDRWRSWTREMHERFEWIAGEQLRYFGYASLVPPVDSPTSALRHRARDWRWQARWLMRKLLYTARVELGTASRPLRQRLGLVRTIDSPVSGEGKEVSRNSIHLGHRPDAQPE